MRSIFLNSSWTAIVKKPLRILSMHLRLDQLKIIGYSQNEGNWSAKTRDQLIWCIKMKQKEIDHDIVIKMFDHLQGGVHMANQNGLQSLQKIWNELIFMFVI